MRDSTDYFASLKHLDEIVNHDWFSRHSAFGSVFRYLCCEFVPDALVAWQGDASLVHTTKFFAVLTRSSATDFEFGFAGDFFEQIHLLLIDPRKQGKKEMEYYRRIGMILFSCRCLTF